MLCNDATVLVKSDTGNGSARGPPVRLSRFMYAFSETVGKASVNVYGMTRLVAAIARFKRDLVMLKLYNVGVVAAFQLNEKEQNND